MVVTSTAVALTRDDGLVQITINQGVKQSLSDARENLAAIDRLTPPAPAGLIIDMSGALPLDPEVRHLYAGAPLGKSFYAVALIIGGSPLGRMMGNVYLRIARSVVPMQLFTAETAAVAWLKERKPHG